MGCDLLEIGCDLLEMGYDLLEMGCDLLEMGCDLSEMGYWPIKAVYYQKEGGNVRLVVFFGSVLG